MGISRSDWHKCVALMNALENAELKPITAPTIPKEMGEQGRLF
jgi:hypothetical protein